MSSSAIRAGAAYIELTLRDGVSRPLRSASIALKDFGNSVAWQGAKIAAMGAAVTAPLAAMAHSFARSAVESGRFASRRDAANVQAYVSSLLRLTQAMTAFRDAVGSAVLPLLTRWPNTLTRIVTQATAWVRANRGLVQTIARLGTVVVVAGTALMVIGKALAIAGGVFGVLATVASVAASAMATVGAVLAAILSPIGLVIAGVVALGAYLLYASGVGQQAIDWLSGAFGGLLSDASEAWEGIYAALSSGDIQQAAAVFWGLINLEWEKGINAINQQWINAKDFFLQTWSNASFTAAGYFIDAWAMVENGWVETVDFLADTWAIFTNVLTKTWHSTIGFIKKAWVQLKALFDKDIDVNAEVNRINNETNAKWAEADNQQNAVIGNRNQSRKERKAEIERNRQAAQANLGQDKAASDNRRQREFDQQRKDSEGKVDRARKGFKKSVDDAKNGEPPPKNPPPTILMPMVQEQKKLESKGTFNALAARGLGSSSLADRTAKATEKSAELLKSIDNGVKQAGGVFT